MLHIVLYQPEIPPNTGNIMRLCMNTGFKLSFIEPLGFSLSDKQLKRAGLDYAQHLSWDTYENFDAFTEQYDKSRIFLCSTKAKTLYTSPHYLANDILVFGPETRGLPQQLLDETPESSKIIIPMRKEGGRSLNLASAVSIIGYEAWRQLDFAMPIN